MLSSTGVRGIRRPEMGRICVPAMAAAYMAFVPAGTWHNVRNGGRCPLKLSSVYAPPHHPWGTVQHTKEDAEQGEH